MTPSQRNSALGVIEVALIAELVERARTPGTPPGDTDDPHEDNTFDLPNGDPIRRNLKRWFAAQQRMILGTIPDIGAPLPDSFPSLANYDDPMASAMTPLISAYWDEGGKETRARLGLDPDEWQVYDPHLQDVIKKSAYNFCHETNATTAMELNDALHQLRIEMIQGLVDHGESIPELTERVESVFTFATKHRAERIARTEASRAVHSASLMSAEESGVVEAKVWLASANSCPDCLEEERKSREHPVPLGAAFSTVGDHPIYANIRTPPRHPHCRCSQVYQLTDEYKQILEDEGPENPEGFQPGPMGPDPKDTPKPKKKPRKPKPKAKPPQPGTPIRPDLPIQERIPLAEQANGLTKRLAALETEKEAAREAANKARLATDRLIANQRKSQGDPGEFAAKLSKLEEEEKKANRKFLDLMKGMKGQAQTVLKELDAKQAFPFAHDGVDDLARVSGTSAEEAIKWLGQKVEQTPGAPAKPITVNWKSIPKNEDQRAYAYKYSSSIHLVDSDPTSTAAHELGHHLEYHVPGVQKAAEEFLEHRVGNEPLAKLNTLKGGEGYEDWEYGREDQFGKAFPKGLERYYVGKKASANSTEIVSMGVEKLYEDPVGFATADPEYCTFILGILNGTLRSP